MGLTCDTVLFVFRGLLSGLMCIVGLFGNALSIAVLWQIGGSSVTYFLLRALAIVDTVYLLAYIPSIVVPEFFYFFGTGLELLNDYQYVIWALYPVASMALTATVWVTTLVTIHRYVAISRPSERLAFFTMRGAVLQVVVVVVFSVLVDVTKYFEREVITTQTDNMTFIKVTDTTALWEDKMYQLIYKNIAMIGIRKIMPIAITFILTILLVRLLMQRKKQREKLFANGKKEQGHTKSKRLSYVLISIASVLIVCQTPMAIYPLFRLVFKISTGCTHFYHYFSNIADWLGVVNSATNFFIYYPAVPTFRQQLLNMFCSEEHSITKKDEEMAPLSKSDGAEAQRGQINETVLTSGNHSTAVSRV